MRIGDVINYFLQQPISVDYDIYNFQLSFLNVVDIVIVTLLIGVAIYKFRKSSMLNVVIGLSILAALSFLTSLLSLNLTHSLINLVLLFVLISLPVMFQNELRTYLYKLGALSHHKTLRRLLAKSFDYLDEITDAVVYMAERKIGALIVITQTDALEKYVKTGYVIDSRVSAPLLKVVFNKNSMLHDGAVIIRDGRIVAAGCVLPNSKNDELNGMRHRAGLGVTEVSDAITIIVSEETGHISIAESGKLVNDIGYIEFADILRSHIKLK